MKRLMAVFAALVLSVPGALAQSTDETSKPLSDTDIQLMRSDVRSDANKIIADTMQFTDAESTAFWPVYRDYSHDQQKVGDEVVKLIKDYATNYDTMDAATAKELIQRLMNTEAETHNLQQDYWPKFMKALGAKRAAKFYQVDRRLRLIVNVQLASVVPLLP
jgi:phage terminase large subunit-like protein